MSVSDQGAAQQPNHNAQHQHALGRIDLIQQTRDAFQYHHDEALSRIAARFAQLDQVDIITATVTEDEELDVRYYIHSQLSNMIDAELDAQVLVTACLRTSHGNQSSLLSMI